ncbi:hypothetical protein [Spirulina subsalsa]|uniref:hypothetical protein n=1 Tax=Spirulina subsalsa TaxID=54311 RepID=UPI0002FE0632|nr:hypothetical protein [Spirulina subsalsa]
MIPNAPSLFGLYLAMRPVLALTLDQYFLLEEAWRGGFGRESLEDLQEVCQMLWLKGVKPEQRQPFECAFQGYFEQFFQSEPSSELPPEKPLSSSQKQDRTAPSSPSSRPPSGDSVWVGEGVKQVAVAVRTPLSLQTQEIGGDGRFSLGVRDFPVTQRQIQQRWRLLRRPLGEGVGQEVDIEATVQRICEQGFFLEPVFRPQRRNQVEVVLLVDVSNSMIPFEPLTELLQETLAGEGFQGIRVYYFRNCPPSDWLFLHPRRPDTQSMQEIYSQFHPQRTVVFWVSDGGAARGGINRERVFLTIQFQEELRQRVRGVGWLNPVPEERWPGTTAGILGQMLPMFELTPSGIKGILQVWRSSL